MIKRYKQLPGMYSENDMIESQSGTWVTFEDCAALQAKFEQVTTEHDAALEALKAGRAELHACQAVIHYAGGFDPAYVNGAQAALRKMDAVLEVQQVKP